MYKNVAHSFLLSFDVIGFQAILINKHEGYKKKTFNIFNSNKD